MVHAGKVSVPQQGISTVPQGISRKPMLALYHPLAHPRGKVVGSSMLLR